VARLASDRAVVQNRLILCAKEAGWTYVSPEEALRQRKAASNPILWDTFFAQAQRLNPGYVDAAAADAILGQLTRVRPIIEGNLDACDEALEELAREMVAARAEQADRDVSTEAFAVLWLLKRRGIDDAPRAAEQVDRAFQEHPHWRVSESEGRAVRRALYEVLDDLRVKEVPAIAEEILNVLRREP
jgi:hypothetical protein